MEETGYQTETPAAMLWPLMAERFQNPELVAENTGRAVFRVCGEIGRRKGTKHVKCIESKSLPLEVDFILHYSPRQICLPLTSVRRIKAQQKTYYEVVLVSADGSLDDFVLNDAGKYHAAIDISHHLVSLEEDGVVHGDIKPENVYLLNSKRPRLYLGDFGTALYTHDYRRMLKHTTVCCGTMGFIPPEQFIEHCFEDCDASEIPVTHDSFSFAMTLFTLVKAYPTTLFRMNKEGWKYFMVSQAYVNEIKKVMPPLHKLPPMFREVILAGIDPSPYDRPTMSELHDLLAGN